MNPLECPAQRKGAGRDFAQRVGSRSGSCGRGKELNDAMASVLSELGAPLSGITLSGGHPSLSRSGFCRLSGYLSASVLWLGEYLDQD